MDFENATKEKITESFSFTEKKSMTNSPISTIGVLVIVSVEDGLSVITIESAQCVARRDIAQLRAFSAKSASLGK